MEWTKTEKRQLAIFFAIAFGVPYLMGIAMAFAQRAGADTSAFANAQMFYPAAGAMLALLVTRRGDQTLPRRFYFGFLVLTALMGVTALGTVTVPALAVTVSTWIMVVGSLVCWVLYFVDGKARRATGGLGLTGTGGKGAVTTVLLFLALYLGRYVILIVLTKLTDPTATLADMGFSADPVYSLLVVVSLPLSFVLAFAPFFGEEYGWRAFLQPLLQKRFGPRAGVVLLGVLWGFWHLPLNVFYYSPATWLQSLTNQIILCVSLAAFFGYAQLKTRTVWVPVILHFLNNNLIAVFAGSTDVISNQVIGWADVAVSGVLLAALYLPSLLSPVFRGAAQPTLPLPAPAEAATPADPGEAKQPPQYGPLN